MTTTTTTTAKLLLYPSASAPPPYTETRRRIGSRWWHSRRRSAMTRITPSCPGTAADSAHFCSWEGVLCSSSSSSSRVTRLNITSRGLIERISPWLGNLTHLQRLVLSGDAFAGGIPPSLGHLQRLQILDLTNNTLQGVIPDQLANCSSLKALQIGGGNDVVGRFPDLPHYRLQILELDRNDLTGHIPAFSCQHHDAECVLVWSIPDELARLSSLKVFDVGRNRLMSIRFPQAILNLSSLTLVFLAVNHLSGEIPSDIGNSLPSLQALTLGMNLFYGNVPYSLMNTSNLHLIDMLYNNFTGVIPSSIGRLTNLSFLNFELNS
uniref:Leucine-rich repeat-containing N-terminal plant-type domain-containing protein n=1 Tax=Oryza punctata TaxID=4537 RepID=A0A0E0MG60_ORYPU